MNLHILATLNLGKKLIGWNKHSRKWILVIFKNICQQDIENKFVRNLSNFIIIYGTIFEYVCSAKFKTVTFTSRNKINLPYTSNETSK